MPSHFAIRLLALFWYGAGTYALVESLWSFSTFAGVGGLAVGEIVLQLKLLSSIGGFGGLVCYLLAIYTGRARVVALVAVAYVGIYASALYYYAWRDPVAQEAGIWGARLVYANPGGGPYWTALVLALFVPPALAALAYASLVRLVRDPAGRYRITVVSLGLLLFFAPMPMGWVTGAFPWWGLAEKLLGLTSALVVVAAFHPPAWARRRFGARPMVEDSGAWALVARPRAPPSELLARASDLV
jgi:hypothetical protein